MDPAEGKRRRADRERFERLYRRHRRDVYRALLRDLAPEDAEDVTQTAFLNAYRAIARGDEPEKPRAWLLTIAENARRRRFRRLHRAGHETELEDEPVAEAAVTAGEVRDALARLPDNQRRALVLRELGGLSYSEIAEHLELTVGAVQMLLFRARRSLRDELVEPSRRRGVGALGCPVPGWLASSLGELGTAGAPTAVLSRAAGVAAAGIAGAALVAGGAARPLESTPLEQPPLARAAAPVLSAAPSADAVRLPSRPRAGSGAGQTDRSVAAPEPRRAPTAPSRPAPARAAPAPVRAAPAPARPPRAPSPAAPGESNAAAAPPPPRLVEPASAVAAVSSPPLPLVSASVPSPTELLDVPAVRPAPGTPPVPDAPAQPPALPLP